MAQFNSTQKRHFRFLVIKIDAKTTGSIVDKKISMWASYPAQKNLRVVYSAQFCFSKFFFY